jgi:hypothetical protein
MEELRDKAAYYEISRLVAVWDVEAAVVKSDVIVSTDLSDSLRKCARELEAVPDHAKDWHPGSNEKVLDLLHPSLFPLVYGRSTALPSGTVPLDGCERFSCKGETVASHSKEDQNYSVTIAWERERTLQAWGSFQWLPSNIHFAEDGSTLIASYINNLHPSTHKELYAVLSQFVTVSIPLWNECLSWFSQRFRFGEIYGSAGDFKLPEGIIYPDSLAKYAGRDNDPEDYDLWEDDEYTDWYNDNKVLIQIEPQPFRSRQTWATQPDHQPVDLQKDFRDSGLQIIFKLANIHLTPEKSEYEGGSWHIEGALNEHICATALYYYDEENISESHLGFRQSLDEESMMMSHEQVIYNPTTRHSGLDKC